MTTHYDTTSASDLHLLKSANRSIYVGNERLEHDRVIFQIPDMNDDVE